MTLLGGGGPAEIRVTEVTGVSDKINYMFLLDILIVTPLFQPLWETCYWLSRCNAEQRKISVLVEWPLLTKQGDTIPTQLDRCRLATFQSSFNVRPNTG